MDVTTEDVTWAEKISDLVYGRLSDYTVPELRLDTPVMTMFDLYNAITLHYKSMPVSVRVFAAWYYLPEESKPVDIYLLAEFMEADDDIESVLAMPFSDEVQDIDINLIRRHWYKQNLLKIDEVSVQKSLEEIGSRKLFYEQAEKVLSSEQVEIDSNVVNIFVPVKEGEHIGMETK